MDLLDHVEQSPVSEHWTARHGKPIVFVILTLITVGVYLDFTIPVVTLQAYPGAAWRADPGFLLVRLRAV